MLYKSMYVYVMYNSMYIIGVKESNVLFVWKLSQQNPS